MDTQQFLVKVDPGCTDSCHFELRLNEAERLFHLSLRFDIGRYVVNELRDGVWGDGVWSDLPEAFDRDVPFLVYREDERVCVFISAKATLFRMDPEAMRKGRLQAAGQGVRWDYLPPVRAAKIELAENSARIIGLHVARNPVMLPAEVPPALALKMAVESVILVPSYLRYLAAATLPAGTRVLDLGTPVLGLAHASLFAQNEVTVFSDETDALRAIIRANRLANVSVLTINELMPALSNTHDATLLQGRNVRMRAGKAIRSPGIVVFDADNPEALPVRATTPRQAAQPALRKAGLDVVVSLFNTLDHVVPCVQSLLCDGRDDIGVIVVDDGSSDGSGRLVAETFSADQRVRVVTKENGGCASARNYGRLVSDRAHIAFVDADDWVDKDFFAGLYDLALKNGAEMVQGGFDFYDETRDPPRWPYGGDLELADIPLESVGGQMALSVPAERLLRGQPTIWRKVYRRDFLDAHDIWFPESIRAYDDYLFHLLTLTYAPTTWMVPGAKYVYRQHPGQDIRQGDARHFNMLAMFLMLAHRARKEGWTDFAPYAQTMTDAIHWSSERLRPELVSAFLQAGAQICVSIMRSWGQEVMGEAQLGTVTHPDFRYHLEMAQKQAAALPDGLWWVGAGATLPHPDTVRMHLALKSSL